MEGFLSFLLGLGIAALPLNCHPETLSSEEEDRQVVDFQLS